MYLSRSRGFLNTHMGGKSSVVCHVLDQSKSNRARKSGAENLHHQSCYLICRMIDTHTCYDELPGETLTDPHMLLPKHSAAYTNDAQTSRTV